MMYIPRLPYYFSILFAGMQLAAMPDAAAATTAPRQVSGHFDITLTSAASARQDGNTTARMVIEKRYHGELDATARGEMLTAVTSTAGSAGYVAIESVNGTLAGRKGGFVLQHAGTRSGGTDRLDIAIVPDSGSGQLAGISGKLAIKIVDGKHLYTLDYVLP